jgi:biotin carboxylase
MVKTVAVLGGGIDSLSILRRIKEMGLRTIVFDADKDAPAREHLADHFVNRSCYNVWEVLTYIQSTYQDIDAVLCAGTDCPDVMALVAQTRGLVGPSPRTAEISMNKWMQKRLFEDAGIKIPKWWAGEYAPDPSRVMVVKPTTNRGSRGVMRVLPGENSKQAVKETDQAIAYAKQFDPRGHTIVEEWIDGVQLSSESLVQNGKIIYTAFSERNYSRLEETHPYVIEDGGDMPPSIPLVYENDYKEKSHEQLQKCVEAMGLRNGTLKGDLVWDGHNIWVIEVACRLSGGSFCSDQIPAVWGVDFVGMAVRIALGETVYNGEIRPYLRRHMSQRFVIPPGTTCHPERGPGAIAYGEDRREAQFWAKRAVRKWEEEHDKS